jgi:GxxExxY protein
MNSKLHYKEESYGIIGACFNVYKEMGNGFLEAVYQECLEMEFSDKKIPFETQKDLQLKYHDQILKQTYKPDFLCYNKIIVEIKALSKIMDEHRAQILNYINGAGFKLGLPVNFGHHPKLEYERFVL